MLLQIVVAIALFAVYVKAEYSHGGYGNEIQADYGNYAHIEQGGEQHEKYEVGVKAGYGKVN